MKKQDPISTPFPTTQRAALYIRQAATPHTVREPRRQSHTESLLAYAHHAGWTDENLLVFNDSGIPASAPLEKREGLQGLIEAIEQDSIKTVLLMTENSLFRHAPFVHPLFFTGLCRKHAVLVVTPERVYNFSKPCHVKQFCFMVEAKSVVIYARTNRPRPQRQLDQPS